MKYCTCGISSNRISFVEGICIGCYAKGIRVSVDQEVVSADLERLKKLNDKFKPQHITVHKIKEQKEAIIKFCKICGKKGTTDRPVIRSKHEDCKKTVIKVCNVCDKPETEDRKFKIVNGRKFNRHEGCNKMGQNVNYPNDYLTPEQNLLLIPDEKYCLRCESVLTITNFYLYPNNVPHHLCRNCFNKERKKYFDKHIDQIKEYQKEYQKNYSKTSQRKEYQREYYRKKYANNPEYLEKRNTEAKKRYHDKKLGR